MCGIVGYVGQENALPILLDGLRRLEYRGYDSAGVALLLNGQATVVKTAGRIARLEERLRSVSGVALDAGADGAAHPGGLDGMTATGVAGRRVRAAGMPGTVGTGSPVATVGIGHTRWATHGRPSDTNAHPHSDCTGRFVVIHNGIIENYVQLREVLEAHGHVFRSETDTEVIPHLLEAYYQGDVVEAVRRVASQLHGAYALAVLCRDEPDRIVAVRLASPLVIGLGEGENFLASDIPALLPYTRRVVVLSDGEMAVLTREGVAVMTLNGQPVRRDPMYVGWDAVQAEKGGYAHFMLKEIHEQPQAVRDTLRGRVSPDGRQVTLPEVGLGSEDVRRLRKVAVVACGTAAHAGLVGRYLIERLAGIPVEWDVASEYRYRRPMVDEGTLFVAISQSGETADTLAALREARSRGARVLTITNVVGSSIARESDWALYTWAGPEIAVASTKAYTTQLVAVTLLAVWLGQSAGRLAEEDAARILAALRALPEQAEAVLAQEERVARMAAELARHDDVFFIGRGLDYCVALEGQLKLKEISCIHAEAYPAGELKHGTLALITRGVPVVALSTQPELTAKMLSNVQEVRAREATVIAVALDGDQEIARHADVVFTVPRTDPLVAPALAVIPLQLLAYYAAVARGHDVDKPRNLAKSVTVE